jgi:micrococcal nuclease
MFKAFLRILRWTSQPTPKRRRPERAAHEVAPKAKVVLSRVETDVDHSQIPSASSSTAYKKKALTEFEVKSGLHQFPRGQVGHVYDGDTFIARIGRDENRIRLDSIDCPEDGQVWGDTARHGLIKLIGGKLVHLELHGEDDYGRTLATIYIPDRDGLNWLNVNERMILLGHAWVMRQFLDHLPTERQQKLIRMEKWARSKKVGLWKSPNPLPPWRWRKDGRDCA